MIVGKMRSTSDFDCKCRRENLFDLFFVCRIFAASPPGGFQTNRHIWQGQELHFAQIVIKRLFSHLCRSYPAGCLADIAAGRQSCPSAPANTFHSQGLWLFFVL